MPRTRKPIVEVLPPSEAALVPAGENLEALLDRMVRERVNEILRERGDAPLEPDFQPREVAYELQRRQTVYERHKWARYFERWGCRRCNRKDVPHASAGFCVRCHMLFTGRLLKIKRDYDKANPEKEINRQIDRITSKIRNARMLLGEGETTGPFHDRAPAYRRRNLAAGLCAYCPRPLAPNSTHYCVECLGKKREGKRKRREEFKARLRAPLQGEGEK